jgi:hypothetical protein
MTEKIRTAQSTTPPNAARMNKLYVAALVLMNAELAARDAAKIAAAAKTPDVPRAVYATLALGSAANMTANTRAAFPAALTVDGNRLNTVQRGRPSAKYDRATVFVDGAPCALSPIDAATLARTVLVTLPDTTIDDAFPFSGYAHTAKNASDALKNTGVSTLARLNMRAAIASPLLAHASGMHVPLVGRIGATSDAAAIHAALIARCDGIIAALNNATE